jgi:hypothetical protein
VEPDVNLVIDGSSVLIEMGHQCVAIGPSEQAQINVIAGKTDRLPEQPQVIFAWTSVISDARVIDLTERGTIDLVLSNEGVTVSAVR